MDPYFIIDPILRERFVREGFAYAPMLDSEDIAELMALYHDTSPRMASGFYTTLWSESLDYRQKVHEGICRVLDRRLGFFLRPAKYVLTQFAVKQGGHTNTECPLHQDWSMIDESRHPCVFIWCPLVDVDAGNGPLAVVPGSHRIASRVRPNMPHELYYSSVTPLYDAFQTRYLRELPMKAGGAIVYDGALTHGSRGNQSLTDRVAVVAALVPEEAQLRHYWMASRNQIEVFPVPDDFYRTQVAVGRRPEGMAPIEVIHLFGDEPAQTEAAFLARTADVARDPVF
jgi:hypothetical protein